VAADLRDQIAALPVGPGCYIFSDAAGVDIYVGKAKNLKRRVASYFQRRSGQPPRTARLVDEISELRIMETGSEVEALLLENVLIKDLQPRFNVNLKDGKEYPLLAISREPFPRVFITRDRDEPGVDLIGPFGSKSELQRAYHFLMKVFQFRCCTLDIQPDDPRRAYFRPCLNYHIKRCSAPCTTHIDQPTYGADIKALRAFLGGRGRVEIRKGLEARMAAAAGELRYEDAARFRDQLRALAGLGERGRLKDYDAPAAPVLDGDRALSAIAAALDLPAPPRVIEGFDVAHLHGEDVVAALISFVDGVPNKDGYRRYKVKPAAGAAEAGNDDFAAMHQVVGRRYRRLRDEERRMPDLILIDGGAGQVAAAARALDELQLAVRPPLVGLAKKEELLVGEDGRVVRLGRRNPGLKLLMYLRDEAHRFSRSYHHLLRGKRMQRGGPKDT
jgi:excinuclease ABC subunit C